MQGRKERNTEIGVSIRQIRKTVGMSQMKLAEKIGVSYQQVQKYENGSSQITISRLEQIANALGVPVYDFIKTVDSGSVNMSGLSDREIKLVRFLRKLENEELQNRFIDLLSEIVSHA
jgi:transcriptional regulator with XRE-family HTH domain